MSNYVFDGGEPAPNHKAVQRVTIRLFLNSLEDLELATLCNIATAKRKPLPHHIGYEKWIFLYGCGRHTLDDDCIDVIVEAVSRRL
ncbi:MAG TPA: hypothetical protein VI728_11090 [Syntrophales bacterium]|nr:hypothetical protein [Syntrophales bacterium]